MCTFLLVLSARFTGWSVVNCFSRVLIGCHFSPCPIHPTCNLTLGIRLFRLKTNMSRKHVDQIYKRRNRHTKIMVCPLRNDFAVGTRYNSFSILGLQLSTSVRRIFVISTNVCRTITITNRKGVTPSILQRIRRFFGILLYHSKFPTNGTTSRQSLLRL